MLQIAQRKIDAQKGFARKDNYKCGWLQMFCVIDGYKTKELEQNNTFPFETQGNVEVTLVFCATGKGNANG
ncbi:MAG: hypothetical protein IKC52_05950 [Clostridia bacterium]|nr:hypothetical protein [Clostridia bacterium]